MDNGLEVPHESVTSKTPGRMHILALSGGGYRGLFAALVLAQLEEMHKTSCRDAFQVMAGTSIGGIIAAALAVGIPADEVRKKFLANGQQIFKHRAWLPASVKGTFLYAPYSTATLETTIRSVLGEHADRKLGEIDANLILPAVSASGARPRVLKH
jgi:uncharacterized protein